MKVFGVLLLTISFSAVTFAVPQCKAGDLDTLWPDYKDNTAFYQCLSVGRYVRLTCQGGAWFSFVPQKCVPQDEWVTPPSETTDPTEPPTESTVPSAPTPDPTPPTAPTPNPTGTTDPAGPTDPTGPSYPPTEPGHPTPPTPPPSEAPTPPPTTAATPPTTLPTAPPTENTKRRPKPPTKP